MNDIGYAVLASISVFLLIAVWSTLKKEKIMIEEGGHPLPTSSYVFLLLKHILWLLAVTVVTLWTPDNWLEHNSNLATYGVTALLVLVSYVLAHIVEVIIRVIVVLIYQAQASNKSNKNGDDDIDGY